MNEHSEYEKKLDAVHEQIETTRSTIESAWNPTAEECRKILTQRAQELAYAKAVTTPEETFDLLCFELSGERYGLESRFVDETMVLEDFTSIPFTPSWVMGIITVHGRFVSIIDIGELIGVPQGGNGISGTIVLLHSPAMEFGIRVDAITGIRTVAKNLVQTDIHMPGPARENYLLGVTNDGLTILDAQRLLSDESLVIREG